MPELRARRHLRWSVVMLAVTILLVAVTGWQTTRVANLARQVDRLNAKAKLLQESSRAGCFRGNKIRLVLTHLLVQDTSPEAPGFLADPDLAQQPCELLYPKEN